MNWAIFPICFQDAVEAKGYWGHFDGTSPRPEATATATADDAAAILQWDKDEQSAKSLLTQKIPDSAMMRIKATIFSINFKTLCMKYIEHRELW